MSDTFAALYKAHAPAIRAYIFRRVSDAELADDLCNEAFCKLLAALRAGRRIRNGKAYAYQIARNLVADHYRERHKAFVGSFEAMLAAVVLWLVVGTAGAW